jgi:putative YhdH/YhfP family quinone oxidoreductase
MTGDKKFKALIVYEDENNFRRAVKKKTIKDLPEGDVLIRVMYSSLNYKDALSASGHKGVTKKYPHTPGIDAGGIVENSSSELFLQGDEVLVTGYDLGMNTSGGFAQYIRVPSAWVVKLPRGLSLKESMILGTAGFTAGLAIYKLINSGIEPVDGEILVTGATGGVGSLSIAMLAKAGYHVTASTGKLQEENYLKSIGASKIIYRDELIDKTGKPLLRGRWSGVIETVGGETLSTVIASAKMGGAVAACGNVSSFELHTTIFPFILRGVALLGINSAETPMDIRVKIWGRIAAEWKPNNLELIYHEHSLEETIELIDVILKGGIKGRALIDVNI